MTLSKLTIQIPVIALCFLYILASAVIIILFFMIMAWCESHSRTVTGSPVDTETFQEYDITPYEDTDEDNVIFNH